MGVEGLFLFYFVLGCLGGGGVLKKTLSNAEEHYFVSKQIFCHRVCSPNTVTFCYARGESRFEKKQRPVIKEQESHENYYRLPACTWALCYAFVPPICERWITLSCSNLLSCLFMLQPHQGADMPLNRHAYIHPSTKQTRSWSGPLDQRFSTFLNSRDPSK